MTDDDAKRHLSEGQRKIWEECDIAVRYPAYGPKPNPAEVLALLRELARTREALGRISALEVTYGSHAVAEATGIARAALATPPTEGNPA